MVKNIFVHGRMQVLLVPEEKDSSDEYSLIEALQAQEERIELLEEQNNALVRQEQILLQLLEISSQTSRVLTDSLMDLKDKILPNQD